MARVYTSIMEVLLQDRQDKPYRGGCQSGINPAAFASFISLLISLK